VHRLEKYVKILHDLPSTNESSLLIQPNLQARLLTSPYVDTNQHERPEGKYRKSLGALDEDHEEKYSLSEPLDQLRQPSQRSVKHFQVAKKNPPEYTHIHRMMEDRKQLDGKHNKI
jgi:hypothetical protein